MELTCADMCNFRYITDRLLDGVAHFVRIGLYDPYGNHTYLGLNDDAPEFLTWFTDEPNIPQELCVVFFSQGLFDIPCDYNTDGALCQRINCEYERLYYSYLPMF